MKPIQDPEPTGYTAHVHPRADGRWSWTLYKSKNASGFALAGGAEPNKREAKDTAAYVARRMWAEEQAKAQAQRDTEPESFDIWTH